MGLNSKRIENRVFFERLVELKADHEYWAQRNQVIPADDWAPDTSLLGVPIQVDYLPTAEVERRTRPVKGIIPKDNNPGNIRPPWVGL